MVGISDTSIGRILLGRILLGRILLGRWVKTIVLSSPKRRASHGAARNESAEKQIGAEDERAQHLKVRLETQVEEERQQGQPNQPTCERIHAEERRQWQRSLLQAPHALNESNRRE